jgi:hypothetical protein
MYPRPIAASYSPEYCVDIEFEDGVRAVLDFSPMIEEGGIFLTLADKAEFARVTIDPIARTLSWPTGVDLCPDVLYSIATGRPLPGPLLNPPAKRISMTRAVSSAAS